MEGQFASDIDVSRVGAGFLRQSGIIGDAAKFDFHGWRLLNWTITQAPSPSSPCSCHDGCAIGRCLQRISGRAGLSSLSSIRCAESRCSIRSEEHTSELQTLLRISYAVLFLTT